MARPAVTEAGNNGDDDNGQRKKRGRWRKGTASSAIMGHGAATEVTGSAGGEQEPVTPGAHPTLFLSGTSAPETVSVDPLVVTERECEGEVEKAEREDGRGGADRGAWNRRHE